MTGDLTPAEARRAHKLGIFTITTETDRGYYVTVFGPKNGNGVARLDQSEQCVRPATARRYGAKLVRAALAGPCNAPSMTGPSGLTLRCEREHWHRGRHAWTSRPEDEDDGKAHTYQWGPRAVRCKHTPDNPNACPVCSPGRCEVARRREQRR